MNNLQKIIEDAWEHRQEFSVNAVPSHVKEAVDTVFDALDQGTLRVAEKIDTDWVVHQWIKKALLLSFKITPNQVIDAGFCQFYDKVPLKYQQMKEQELADNAVRIVPHAMIRRGAFIGKNTILMPSYVNIGAYIDTGAMIDTWATVGSCAQIGKNVHLSGGAGIGGVLEPLQANPTIIEDDCFIGARSEVVEGVIVEKGSVLSMGVFLGQSTKIYNRLTKEITYGRIPAGSVVVPGNLPADNGAYSMYCAVIIKQVDEKTRAKVSINELLRDTQ